MKLKGGHQTKDPRLDRIPQFDDQSHQYRLRSLVLGVTPLEQRKPRSFTWAVDHWLDQGSEGRCVEFCVCHDLLARPLRVRLEFVEQILAGKLIYWPAQEEDEWPGGSYPEADPQYEGTSVLAGVKIAARLGFYGEYRWAMSLLEALLGLGFVGPLILGINWYEGMFDVDDDGWIHVEGDIAGGHAILAPALRLVWQSRPPTGMWGKELLGYLDLDRSYLTLHNSWGPGWGVNGRAKLSLRDFDRVRREYGEVCIATRRLQPKTLIVA